MIELSRAPSEVDGLHLHNPHHSSITALAFCDTLRLYMSASVDHTIQIRDFGHRLVHTLTTSHPPFAANFVDEGGNIAVGQVRLGGRVGG